MNFFQATSAMHSPPVVPPDSEDLELMSDRTPSDSIPVYAKDYAQYMPYWMNTGSQTFGGYIGQETALNYSAFWAGVTLYGAAMSVPPMKIMKKYPDGHKEWADQHPTNWMTCKAINDWMTPAIWQNVSMTHLLMSGNTVDVISRNNRGQAVALEKILPINTRFAINNATRLPVYGLRHAPVTDSAQMYYQNGFPDSQWEWHPHEDILHIKAESMDGRIGRSVMQQARNSIGLGITMDRFQHRMFTKGRPVGFISKPGRLTDKDRELIRDEWRELQEGVDNAFNIGILHGGMDWKQVGWTAQDTDLLLNKAFGVREMARWLRLPPFMLGDMSETAKASIEDLMMLFIEMSLQPWIQNWEQEMNLKLFTPREQFIYEVVLDMDAFLRGNLEARKKAEEMDIRNGVQTLDEVRAKYNLAPYPDGMGAQPLIIASQLDYLKNVFMGKSMLQGGGKGSDPAKTKESA